MSGVWHSIADIRQTMSETGERYRKHIDELRTRIEHLENKVNRLEEHVHDNTNN